ncbi:cupin domain-containing protein [Actinacidiphila epipremni]|jgi:quercetin dioxygenase-like cupin family protein|uniref:Cupin domain-containing protein n=1 Tax=Actinacidiphila epipremni TaxID=2053013 RepID=A0ABX0ZUA3_9ACTN|nr:cupin domain-containing protein [Actinacidiphila epipremni]NJP47470.1 cupin domain-containing protein [Actinacidiphila epipremni]
MPFITADEAVVHELHGVRFVSYAASARGSEELCAWRGELPPGSGGPAHTISREEVFLVLSGELDLTIDGTTRRLSPGDAAVAPAGATLAVANSSQEPAAMWVTTSVGLSATLPDGSRISPPWAS